MNARKLDQRMFWMVAATCMALGAAPAAAQTAAAPAAQDKTVRFEEQDGVSSVLKRVEGRKVSLRLAGHGELLVGKIQKVGKDLVHVTEISGREFYDAFIRIDQIASVEVQVRGR